MIRTLCAALLALAGGPLWAACSDDSVELRGKWGQARFAVEVVDTPEERAQGLMFRESLPTTAGMLFLYDSPQPVSFWMKNTLIPLDMIFVGPNGEVRHVHHRAKPGDLRAITAGPDIVAVLEVGGGVARRFGIGQGTQMRHSAFAGANPVWPC